MPITHITDITDGVALTARDENAPILEFQITNAKPLAIIRTEKTSNGGVGGKLSFETNNGTEAKSQLVIDDQGRVGIATKDPQFRLHVQGEVKFKGPLTLGDLQVGDTDLLTVTGNAKVMGKLEAESFAVGPLAVSDEVLTVGGDAKVAGTVNIGRDAVVTDKVQAGGLQVGPLAVSDKVGIGVSEVKPDSSTPTMPDSIILDVGSRMRVRQRVGNTSGIWFHQLSGGDKAFVGMVNDDTRVGFWGVGFKNWGLLMNTNDGSVEVAGKFSTGGGKGFKIDHPLDPANQYLNHWCVESPNIMNIYNGNVTTDAEGSATVVLPDYFDALNSDVRYQLTAIGKLALASVEREIENNSFTIRTNQPKVKVSWQVTGIRQDAWTRVNRVQAEEEKPAAERGLYVHPEYFGQPKNKGIAFANFSEESESPAANQT